MSLTVPTGTDPSGIDAPATDPSPPETTVRTGRSLLEGRPGSVVRWIAALLGAFVVYGAILASRGVNPFEALDAMRDSAIGDSTSIGETLIRATPLLFAALAVVVPARAGLFNIGGEGQLLLGAIGATGVSFMLDGAVPRPLAIVLAALGGAALGALWAAIPAVLRLVTNTNEAITSLLLNYVAGLVLTWLVFEPWKDPASLGQAYSEELDQTVRLPILWDRVHIGVLIAVVMAVAAWLLLRSTAWGFRLGVLGGNEEAARRAGFRVSGLALAAMIVGGALAGIGGMVEVSGVEARLRPELLAGFGYMGFLASWLARHHALKAILASLVLGAIAVGGFGLKIATGLSGAAVNILMALILLAVLGFAPRKEAA